MSTKTAIDRLCRAVELFLVPTLRSTRVANRATVPRVVHLLGETVEPPSPVGEPHLVHRTRRQRREKARVQSEETDMATKTNKTKTTAPIGAHLIGKLVLVRTYSAGVHIGVLADRRGKVARLTDARRLWRWRGANTLSEVATRGCDQAWTRLSEPVPEIVLTEAIEVLPVSEAARASLTTSRWGS